MVQVPTIKADTDVLASLIAHGASFFPVSVSLDDNGRCIKKPNIKEWQKSASFAINDASLLNGHAAYGFHPETIGAFVIDLDEKGGKSGERTLLEALGCDLDEIIRPACYCDTPNGRHLYFRAAGLPPHVLQSRNNVLAGVDVRGDHRGGWLIAPGSVGWSLKAQEWRRYEFEGDLDHLPEMPSQLVSLLGKLLSSSAPDELPSFLAPAAPEELLPEPAADPHLTELFTLVSDLIRSAPFFDRLVPLFVPNAVRDANGWTTGNYAGAPGASCKWTPSTGIIKDFAEAGKGGDLLWWVERQYGLLPVAAARLILEKLSIPDPSAPLAAQTTAEAIASAAALVASAAAPDDPSLLPTTDSGNERRIVAKALPTLRYNQSSKYWMAWDGMTWKPDLQGARVMALTLDVAHDIAQQAMNLGASSDHDDQERAKKLSKWATACEAYNRRNVMCTLAERSTELIVDEQVFDSDIDALNTLSGVIDLRTGEIRPHDSSSYHTKLCPHHISHDPPSRFLLFLSEAMGFDASLMEWMRIYFGYCLTGQVGERLFPIWWGGGRNGKSVLLSILAGIMGDYCMVTSAETWLKQANAKPVRDDLAVIKGSRFVWASEPSAGRAFDIGFIKSVTGGELVNCRHLYGRPFSYKPTFKTAFVTNHKPIIKETGESIWDRVRFIPFLYRVPEDRVVKDLDRLILEDEAPQILGWMIEAAADWYAHGFPDCPTITAATSELQENDDILGEFVLDKCIVNPAAFAPFDQAWNAYRNWNEDKGIHGHLSRASFKMCLSDRVNVTIKKQGIKWIIQGLGIKAELT